MTIRRIAVALFGFAFVPQVLAAELLPIDSFARIRAIDDVSVSPDGRYLSAIRSVGDKSMAIVFDRKNNDAVRAVSGEDKEGKFRMRWCRWANNTRLVCGFRAMMSEAGVVFAVTRMIAVNADGTDNKVLIQNGAAGASQFQDQVLDWTPDDPETILVEADKDRNGFPEAYELNIYNGNTKLRIREHEPIRSFVSDSRGNVRLGYGMSGSELSYYARLAGDNGWTRLEKFKAFSKNSSLRPIAITTERNKVYASGPHEGRDALWELDLADRADPSLVFSHPEVDADDPLLAKDGRMLGIYYETDRPFAFYTDRLAANVVDSVKRTLPESSFNVITDYTPDNKYFVIRSSSDVDAGTYYVLDRAAASLRQISTSYPELSKHQDELARMRSIRYTARDGTDIFGYLTVPTGKRAEQLPLVVMPHGGPISRDSWSFNFLVQFLANRGFAVLQMNFRGSSGYGEEWLYAAHQDWGGLTYDDITDGARWAVQQGIADPKRMCIVGWSFGGYAALLGAVRNSDLYRCSVSIAGVSDLIRLQDQKRFFTIAAIAREQIGTDREKLKLDSPQRHAEQISIPVLLIHGDMDAQVIFDQSDKMADALKKAKKPYKLVRIQGASHQLDRQSDRTVLLTELEAFLLKNLGP